METVVLDFTKCKYIGSIHKVIKESLGFPEYYGENLSALWDCLDNYCDYRLHIFIKGFHSLPKEFDEYKYKIWDIFCRVNASTPNITFEVLS